MVLPSDESVGQKAAKYVARETPGWTKRLLNLLTTLIKGIVQLLTDMVRQALGRD